MERNLLVVEDDPAVAALLARFFEPRGWHLDCAASGREALEAFERERSDVVILDLHLPDRTGIELLPLFLQKEPDAAIILLTGDGDVANAVEAMRCGAENFLTKPVNLTHLEAAVERAYEKVELRRRSRDLAARRHPAGDLDALGSSGPMREIARRIDLIAQGDATVLLLGETGVGKGRIAELIHARSPRAHGPFIDTNCAGLTATFLDSELFGHEKGAFTDAKTQKRGLFEVAHRGTLFLDEIGDLAPELQPKLLKALESRRFRRLGGTREITVDVRLIAATNRDLHAAARNGTFREDLYYRLAVVPLRIPTLRERGPDAIAQLATSLLAELRRHLRQAPARIAPRTLRLLQQYAWPGNVRELRNVLERALLLAGDADEILPHHLPPELLADAPAESTPAADLPSLAELERAHIERVLQHHRGNRSRSARTLGISRVALYDKLRRYGLDHIGRPAPARPSR